MLLLLLLLLLDFFQLQPYLLPIKEPKSTTEGDELGALGLRRCVAHEVPTRGQRHRLLVCHQLLVLIRPSADPCYTGGSSGVARVEWLERSGSRSRRRQRWSIRPCNQRQTNILLTGGGRVATGAAVPVEHWL
jgi:hypothetical protein